MPRWSPERGWTSLAVRIGLLASSAGVLAWGLTTTIAIERPEGPSTLNIRTVVNDDQDRQALIGLIEQRVATDAARRAIPG